MTARATEPDGVDTQLDDPAVSRRGFLKSACAASGSLALSATAPGMAFAAPAQALRANSSGPLRVSKARLNALAAKFYTVFNEGNILPASFADKHVARYDVELRRIVTFTRIPETGERVKVSGLLAVPAGARGALPILSWQHGTILSFDQVPSNLLRLSDENYELRDNVDSIETLFNIQRFAGNGYAVIAADYVGKGPYRNGRGEAYAVKGATVQCCLDILKAGLLELRKLGLRQSSLFLNGWSQGALNTQWLKQEMQRRGIKVRATAKQSPFNNLSDSFHYWANPRAYLPASESSYPMPPAWITPCMIVLLGSYRRYYGLNDLFKTAIKPQYQAFAEKYWADYSLDGEIAKRIPPAGDFLTDGFFERFTSDTNSKLMRQLGDNGTTFWHYDSPIKFYYGLADEALPPRLVQPAVVAGGHFADGVPVKGASHRGTFLASLYGDSTVLNGSPTAFDWFNTLV
ncbi:twin-arginine translocation signal domain-containing protein [Bradyrhizobium sp. CCBAU 53415]|uniref:twin-arginine translocation signal domain-containing protein n=1 Tax=Bradyrhizobium sp. CCBAU 53415 TaxID=1325119 RepID=UPI0023063299|nr:twin-arginine translocation signal domain-containing protein [Bradyrhizobium sp. CCBAU 53415]MDA9465132.1 lysophospholipase [Bradyrhizobium sp. CCBAU 53415]